jgi:hypothetical protein
MGGKLKIKFIPLFCQNFQFFYFSSTLVKTMQFIARIYFLQISKRVLVSMNK